MNLSVSLISVGARDSSLSKVQVEEVLQEIRQFVPGVDFAVNYRKVMGDLDRKTSLLSMEKTNFFTKELDEALLEGSIRLAIHSAKDLPDPLLDGLVVGAYTKGVDSSDVLVFKKGGDLASLPFHAKIGTSSLRRIENLKALREDLAPVDIRGTIEERLALLDLGFVDALIMAKAALIRLGICRDSMLLPGPVSPLQGKLAVLVREDDEEMRRLCSYIHVPPL